MMNMHISIYVCITVYTCITLCIIAIIILYRTVIIIIIFLYFKKVTQLTGADPGFQVRGGRTLKKSRRAEGGNQVKVVCYYFIQM
jgi:uncharacterized membrane protein YqiK